MPEATPPPQIPMDVPNNEIPSPTLHLDGLDLEQRKQARVQFYLDIMSENGTYSTDFHKRPGRVHKRFNQVFVLEWTWETFYAIEELKTYGAVLDNVRAVYYHPDHPEFHAPVDTVPDPQEVATQYLCVTMSYWVGGPEQVDPYDM